MIAVGLGRGSARAADARYSTALAAVLARDEVGNQVHRARAGTARPARSCPRSGRAWRRFSMSLHAARFELEHRRRCCPRRRARRSRASSSGSVSSAKSSTAGSSARTMKSQRQSRIVSVVRPRKSNLTRPTASTSSLSNWRHRRCRARLHVQRAEVGELARRDQHAAGVHADVARHALELLGQREQLARPPPRSAARARRAAAPSLASRSLERRSVTSCRAGTGSACDAGRRTCSPCRARGRRRAPPPSPPSCRRWRSATPRRAPYFCFT